MLGSSRLEDNFCHFAVSQLPVFFFMCTLIIALCIYYWLKINMYSLIHSLYYSENLPAVRTFVNNWTSAGLLVSRAKDAINVEDLVPDLDKINQYQTLAANVVFLKGSACTITGAYRLMKNMQFDDDPCAIKDFIKNDFPSLI